MSDNSIEFVILHTNDLHSVFESMPRIRSFFRKVEREQPPERLLRFDIGDHMDRMRPETEGTMGTANIGIMNATGYDAAAPGNNEGLTFPAEALEELYGRLAKFPVVAANLHRLPDAEGRDRTSWTRPSILLERAGIRFGVVGLTAAFNDFYRELGWEAGNPFAAAAVEVARLRSAGEADVVIVLSHLGINYDRRLAEEVDGIDLILGGHTHHLMPELERIGRTYIGAAGKFGTHVGIVRLEVDAGRRQVVRCTGGAVDVTEEEPDEALTLWIEQEAAAAAAHLDHTIAHLDRPLPVAVDRESPLGNLLAGALRRHCGAEIGVVNAGQLLGGLEAGPVTAAALHAICPSPINPCCMLLRGASLWQAVQQSLQEEFISRTIRGYGFRGKVLGTLCLDGAMVETEAGSDAPPHVVGIAVGGEPLDPERWYRVGTIDMFTFRIGYESLSEGTEISYRLPEFLRDLLADTLASPRLGRWIDEAEAVRFFTKK